MNKILQATGPVPQPDPHGLGYVLYQKMMQHRDKAAQVDGNTGQKLTFADLALLCSQTVTAIRAFGLKPGDFISTCSSNTVKSNIPFLAALMAGVIAAPLDPDLDQDDTLHTLQLIKPSIIFVSINTLNKVKDAVKCLTVEPTIVVFETSQDGFKSFDDFIGSVKYEAHFEAYQVADLSETAFVLFSSGTTGAPKGICTSHFGFLSQIQTCLSFRFCLDTVLLFTGHYWMSATMFLCSCIYNGSELIIVTEFNKNTVWEMIERHKPTFINIAPHNLLLMAEAGVGDVSSVKEMRVSGGALLEQHILRLRGLMPTVKICTAYGMTETTMFVTGFNTSFEHQILMQAKPKSCGLRLPIFSYKIVDPDTGNIFGVNEIGELRLKSKVLFNGYLNHENAAVWDEYGWFKTGDLMYYDEDECFYMVDRSTDMLKYKQFHVSPQELESILLNHKDVKNAVVVGVPHEIDGDHPTAVVIINESSTTSPDDVKMFVNNQIDPRKHLQNVRFVKYIPSSSTGKVKRRDIRDLLIEGKL